MLSGTRLLSKHHHHLCGVNTLSVLLDARHIVFQKTSKPGQGHIPIPNEPLIRLANQSWTPLILHGTRLPPFLFAIQMKHFPFWISLINQKLRWQPSIILQILWEGTMKELHSILPKSRFYPTSYFSFIHIHVICHICPL